MHSIGVNYVAWDNFPMPDNVRLLADTGFDAVFSEYWSPKNNEEFAGVAAANHLAYESLHAPFGHINDIWLPGDAGEAMLQELCDCVDTCHALAVPVAVIHLSSGNTPPSITDLGRARWDVLVDRAVKTGVTLAFENQRKLANLAYIFETYADVNEVRFCWDVGHEACFTDGMEFMPLFGKKLVYTHIHDNFSKPNGDAHLIPLDGNINFHRRMELLKQYDYQGTLTLEILPKASDQYNDVTSETYYQKAFAVAKKLREML